MSDAHPNEWPSPEIDSVDPLAPSPVPNAGLDDADSNSPLPPEAKIPAAEESADGHPGDTQYVVISPLEEVALEDLGDDIPF